MRGKRVAFTKPSRGISEAKVEPQSTETLSFRCWSERCRLMRGAVNNQNSKVAFTLAEVLITLGIIGVVAALTLPALIQNYRERAFVTAAKKNYSILTNAVNQWSANNGSIGDPTLFWLANGSNYAALQELGKELNAVKICDYSEIRNCGGGYDVLQYKRVNNGSGNTAEENWVSSYPRIILADGTFVSLSREAARSGSCEENAWVNDKDENGNYIKDETSPSGFKGHYYTNTVCGRIAFDTNGLKGPNQIGVDVFELAYYGNGRVGANTDGWGNIDYVLKNDKLIKTEKYTPGKF